MTDYEVIAYWGTGFLLVACITLIAIEVFYD